MSSLPEKVRVAVERAGSISPAASAFLGGLDAEYFGRVGPAEAVAHARMAAELTDKRPVRVRIEPADDAGFEVAIVAFDYFAEFPIVCGVLSAHGLNIESGHVHTSVPVAAEPPPPPPPRRPGRRRAPGAARGATRKIVDVFRVRPRHEPPDARLIETDLLELLTLVSDGRGEVAREQLNRRLVESLERQEGGSSGPVAPVDIDFDNPAGSAWTTMHVRGTDAPGFLYALANALAMRGIYVRSVLIESVGDEARDRFVIARRDGSRIESAEDQHTLRLAVALIKQFTQYLPHAPDPGLALQDFDQLLDGLMAEGPDALRLFASPEGLRELARLLGSSAFLWEDFLRRQLDNLRPLLEDWKTRPLRDREALGRALGERLAGLPDADARVDALNAFKDEEMLLVDLKHVLDPDVGLERFSSALSDLADAVVAAGVDLAHARLAERHGEPRLDDGGPCPLAVFGLGKYGGREMGYASDLELLFVYAGAGSTDADGTESGRFYESLVRELKGLLRARSEGIFQLDLRLRPHGSKGPLASPLEALRDYYRPGGGAAAFERQALLKLRPITGPPGLIEAVERVREGFVWSEEPWDRANAVHLRERQARELVPAGRVNVKYSRGCMVGAEYAVQYLQLLHGREHPDVRHPSTLGALDALRAHGIVSSEEASELREAYLFWRRVAEALRMVHGTARDLLLPEEGSRELGFLARRLGYRGASWLECSQALLADVAHHRDKTLALFERVIA